MTSDEFSELWIPARNNYMAYLNGHRVSNFSHYSHRLVKLIGACAHEYEEWHSGQASANFPMNDELREILLALSGPHANTMIKVLEIRKGITHEVE